MTYKIFDRFAVSTNKQTIQWSNTTTDIDLPLYNSNDEFHAEIAEFIGSLGMKFVAVVGDSSIVTVYYRN
jgi:hypothetical protein